jgi:hypothetical protein
VKHIPKPGIGNYQGRTDKINSDTFELSENRHVHGLCFVCDAQYVCHRTLGEVEDYLHQGRISQIEYEAYTWVWATTAERLADWPRSWYEVPEDPLVQEVGEMYFGIVQSDEYQENLKRKHERTREWARI